MNDFHRIPEGILGEETVEKTNTELFLSLVGQYFPEAIKDGEVDFTALKEEMGEFPQVSSEHYEFTWAGKQAAKKEAQADLFGRTLKYKPQDSLNPDTTENIYIEGDNLEALKLLRRNYHGKIKMIYIDPPYNTGNDFVYHDDFSMTEDELAKKSGDVVDGIHYQKNVKDNSRYHTNWLNMMYPRLKIARELLSDDGVIFISIDDYEYDNLKKLCDNFFGNENMLANLIWDLGTGTTAGHFTRGHEYVLCYAKRKELLPNFKNFNKNEIISHGALKKISYKNPAVEITFPKGFEFDGDSAVFKGEIGDSEKEYILSPEMRFENGKLVAPTTIKAGFAMRNQVESFIAGKEVFDTKGQKVIRFYFNSKRSVYRYKLDKDEFIHRATAGIENQLLRKNDFIQFEITKAEVDFNDSRKMKMANAQKQVEDSDTHTITYEPKPLFDLVNVIMANTMLPRLAIIRIIKGLSAEARNKINNQDYLEEAIKTINKLLKEFKSKEFLTAELIEGVGALEKDIFEVDKIVNEDEIKYLFTPNPAHKKAMNLKYKFDSEGEWKFAKALDDDPNVMLYTKLKKGGFVLETPAGNYSPDWAIVYQKDNDNFAMYFIAETKWDKEADGLNDDERIKIKCATKHFEAINQSVKEVVKYAWVNAYKDTTKGQPFPQVFTDERYKDTLILERL